MRAAAVVVVLAGCHYHREPDAPGLVDMTVPPRHIESPQLEVPGDPGERMVMLTYGGLAGGGYAGGEGAGDFAAEVSVTWGESEKSHNDHQSRLFIPRGALWPERGYGVTLGWSALQAASDIDTGPLYVEVQRLRAPVVVGGGWAVEPTTGDHGPQVNVLLGVTYLRSRYLIDGGFEIYLGYQLKIPTTWVWSR